MVEATWYLPRPEMDGIPGGRSLRVASDASTPQALRTASLVRFYEPRWEMAIKTGRNPGVLHFWGAGYDLYYENLVTIDHTTNNLGHHTLQ